MFSFMGKPAGFSNTPDPEYSLGLREFTVNVDSTEETDVIAAHLKNLEQYNLFLEQVDVLEILRLRVLDLQSWSQKEQEKINKALENIRDELGRWSTNMPPQPCEETKKFSELFKIDDAQIKKMFQDLFDDFCTLTIITKGAKEGNAEPPQIKTEIKISGDITSETNLSGENLTAFHEQMLDVSVNLVKTYVQVIIQIVGILMPFAGVTQVTSDTFKSITELVKSFNVKETSQP